MRFHQIMLFLGAGLYEVSGQTCNNSPSLCSRQYNNITYLGAHNSPFLRDSSTGFSTSGNQYYNTSVQLAAGVRLLTAQVQTPSDSTALHVCHSSCSLLDSGTLSSWLSEIKTWMDSNPNEVITILLVNGAGAIASALAEAYTTSGLVDLAYTPPSIAANGSWPTLGSLIGSGTRVMNFVASLESNTAAPYLMNEFTYIFENSYDNSVPGDFSCSPKRPTSIANATTKAILSGYLSLMNHFLYEDQAFGIQSPNETYIRTTNAPGGSPGNLGAHAAMCASAYGKAPTFMLVDFFNVGPAIAVADNLNGISPTGSVDITSDTLMDTSSAIIGMRMTPLLWYCCAALVVYFIR